MMTWGVITMTTRMVTMRIAPVLDACGLAGGTPWGGDVTEWGNCHFLLQIFEDGECGW